MVIHVYMTYKFITFYVLTRRYYFLLVPSSFEPATKVFYVHMFIDILCNVLKKQVINTLTL